MGRPLNRTGVPLTREQEVPPVPVEPIDTSNFVEREQLEAVEQEVAGKASGSSVVALAMAMPVIADETPLPEKTGGDSGIEGRMVPGARHRHPRLTSTTGNLPLPAPPTHVIAANGRATIRFTRTFDQPPGCVFTEVPPLPAATMSEFPAQFRVEEWTREGGLIVGCVVRAWRGRALPVISLLTGILNLTGVNSLITALTGFNPFAAPAVGTAFTCIAVARSDT